MTPSHESSGTALTAFQVHVAQVFFALPASSGFLLAGGAALLAQHLSERPTQDLDLFTRGPHDVTAARDAFSAACAERGWSVQRLANTPTFCRLVVRGGEELVVDLAVDSPPIAPPPRASSGRRSPRSSSPAARSWHCSTAPPRATSSTSWRWSSGSPPAT